MERLIYCVRNFLACFQFTDSVQEDFKVVMVDVLNDFCSENECGLQSIMLRKLVQIR